MRRHRKSRACHSTTHQSCTSYFAAVNVRAVQGNRSDLRSQLIASLGLNAPSSSAAPHSYFQPPSAGRCVLVSSTSVAMWNSSARYGWNSSLTTQLFALSIFRGIAPGAAQNGRAVTHPPGIPAGVVPPPSEPPPQQQQQAPPPQVPPPSQKLSLQDPPQPLQLQSQPLQQQTQQQSGQKRQGMVDQSAETADASKQQRQQ